jgi:hypothetical protein
VKITGGGVDKAGVIYESESASVLAHEGTVTSGKRSAAFGVDRSLTVPNIVRYIKRRGTSIGISEAAIYENIIVKIIIVC